MHSIRIEHANQWIESWATNGRRFFNYNGNIAYFHKNYRYGQLFFHNEWNNKDIYVNRLGIWRGFHHGGTLKSIVWFLSKWIRNKTDKHIIASNLRYNNITGYDNDIEYVIKEGIYLGIVSE